MVKRLIFFILCCCFSLASWGAIRGIWEAKVQVLPNLLLEKTTFQLNFLNFWKVSSTAEISGADGWIWQTFEGGFSSAWGDFKATALFGPKVNDFLYLLISSKLSLRNLAIGLYSAMAGTPLCGPSAGSVVEITSTWDKISICLRAGFGSYYRDFSITYYGAITDTKIFPIDPFPGGFQFTYLEFNLASLPFCCGVSLNLVIKITKAGFDSLVAQILDLVRLCCGISMDVQVAMKSTDKKVDLILKWGGLQNCLTVYGDAIWGSATHSLQGVEIYGFKIGCEITECSSVEFLTAFKPDKIEEVKDTFEPDEFEQFKLKVCGLGCCQKYYESTVSVFFAQRGALLGVHRLIFDLKVPIFPNLTVWSSLIVPTTGRSKVSLSFGWKFGF